MCVCGVCVYVCVCMSVYVCICVCVCVCVCVCIYVLGWFTGSLVVQPVLIWCSVFLLAAVAAVTV